MDCCKTLGNIEKQCGGGAAPGIAPKIWLACVDRILSIPAPDDYASDNTLQPHTITDDIIMTVDDAATADTDETGIFYCWNHKQKDGSYVAEANGDDGDQGWTTTLTMFIPKLNPLTTYILNNTANGDYVVIFDDKCGNRRLIGDLVCGGAKVTTKEQTNDKNGYEVTITWDSSYLPYYYTGAIVT